MIQSYNILNKMYQFDIAKFFVMRDVEIFIGRCFSIFNKYK